MSEPQQRPRRSPSEFSPGRFRLNVALTVLMGVLAVMWFMKGSTVSGIIAAALFVWNVVVTRQEWSKRR